MQHTIASEETASEKRIRNKLYSREVLCPYSTGLYQVIISNILYILSTLNLRQYFQQALNGVEQETSPELTKI